MSKAEISKRSGTARPGNQAATSPALNEKRLPTALKTDAVPSADVQLAGAAAAAPAAPKRELAVPKTKTTYEARMRRLAPIVQVRRKLESTIKRFSNLAVEVRKWKNAHDLREAVSKVETALAGLLAEANTTADTFQPERDRKATANQLQPGTKLALREKFITRYEGILDADERANLEVVATAHGHVSVKTVRGARIVLVRSHLAKSDVESRGSTTRAPGAFPSDAAASPGRPDESGARQGESLLLSAGDDVSV